MRKPNAQRIVIRAVCRCRGRKRQTEEQTFDFSKAAVQRYGLPCNHRDLYDVILRWLLPCTGKP